MQLRTLISFLILAGLLVGFSSCRDSLTGAPIIPPIDTLAGTNGEIYFTQIVPQSNPLKADITISDSLGNHRSIGADGLLFAEPGRTKLLFSRVDPVTYEVDIVTSDLNGGARASVPIPTGDGRIVVLGSASIEPNGEKVAYGKWESKTNNTTLHYLLPQGGVSGFIEVEVAANLAEGTIPVFSPDGTKIAYFTQRFDLQGQIDVLGGGFPIADISGQTITYDVVVNGGYEMAGVETIDWSPTGDRVVFSAGGAMNVYTLQGRSLSSYPNSGFGAFSPRGDKIAYSLFGFESSQLAVFDLTTGNTTSLTFTPDSLALYPHWSPDGRWIVYSSGTAEEIDEGELNIKIIQADQPENHRQIGTNAARGFWLRRQSP